MSNKDFFIHESSYVDENVTIGKDTNIWHFSHIQKGANIGHDCTLGQNVNVGKNVKIGNHVKIQNNVSVYNGVELEDYVFCGPSMVFTNVLVPRSKYPCQDRSDYTDTLVKTGASIGANATIICGNTIGKHSFIGAGSVVTKDVPDYAVMVGVPATQKNWICECGEILGKFNKTTQCLQCERKYALDNDKLREIK